MRKLGYTLKQALTQIFRNRAMTLASVFAITAMLLILGLFFLILVNINTAASVIKQDYDTIEIYLLDKTTKAEAEKIISDIKMTEGVESATYRNKEEALTILKTRWGENAYLLNSLKTNPLPNSIVIKMSNLDYADGIAKQATTYKGIEDVKYYQETVDKLVKATNFIQLAGIIIMAFLIIVALVVVSNTVKLTVFARAREINIMKYIGATSWFIRGPFLAEGIIIGIFSALVSAGITMLVYGRIIDMIGSDVLSILSTPMVPVRFMGMNLIWIFTAIGVCIGTWGSIISMRRFLDR